jgi:glycosyltransferase involved in cell wall biosynthesis
MRHSHHSRREVVNGVAITRLPASRERAGRLSYALDYAWFFLLSAGVLAVRDVRRPYAVVQVNTMPDFLVFAAAVPKLLGSRVVAYMNEPSPELAETLYGPGRLSHALERIEQWALRFADHAVTVTDELKQRYIERGASADRITVVLNAPDPQSWTPDVPVAADRSSDEFTIICHGSIEERYGQDTIIEAAHLLRNDLPDLRVVLTGRGSRVDEIVRMIEEFDLEEMVRFEGWVSRQRLKALLSSADAGVVAQKASPYSHLVHTNKMVDYWIFGLPVIASRLRAVSALYDDSILEYFESGDASDLARAIRRLHDDPDRREELSENGRRAQEQNGWGIQRQTYLAVYHALLER